MKNRYSHNKMKHKQKNTQKRHKQNSSMDDKRDILYNNLINSGKVTEKNIGTIDKFKESIKDEESARKFYRNLAKSGKFSTNEIGDEDKFYNSIKSDFTEVQQLAEVQQPQQPSKPTQTQQPAKTATINTEATQQSALQSGNTNHNETPVEEEEKPLGPTRFEKLMEMQTQLGDGTRMLNNGAIQVGQVGAGLTGKTKGTHYNNATGKYEDVYYDAAGIGHATDVERQITNAQYRKQSPEWRQREFEQKVEDAVWPLEQDNTVDEVWDAANSRIAERFLDNDNYVFKNSDGIKQYVPKGGKLSLKKAISHEAIRLSELDLEKLFEEAWAKMNETDKSIDGLPEEYQQRYRANNTTAGKVIAEVEKLMKENTTLDAKEAHAKAESLAKTIVYKRLYEKAVAENMPRYWIEYLLNKVNSELIGAGFMAIARTKAGTHGDLAAARDAMSRYAGEHGTSAMIADVLSMLVDPSMAIGGGAAKLVSKGMTKMATGMVGRRLLNSAGGKITTVMLGGSANFATFESLGEFANQMALGGELAEGMPGTKQEGTMTVGGFNMGTVGERAGHGAAMGAIVGVLGHATGVTGKALTRKVDNIGGKLAIRGTVGTVGATAEATVFASPEMFRQYRQYNDLIEAMSNPESEYYIEDEIERHREIKKLEEQRDKDLLASWKDNVAMIGAFKLQGAVKSAPEVIAYLRGKRGNSRVGFETRLKNLLDGENGEDLALTADEIDELRNAGYGDFSGFSVKALRSLKEHGKEAETEQVAIYDEVTREDAEGDAARQRYTDLVNNDNISASARAKVFYYLTGYKLPIKPIVGASMDELGGRYFVRTYGTNGEIVTSRTYENETDAQREYDRQARVAEVNIIHIGEKRVQEYQLEEAIRLTAKALGVKPEDVYRELSYRDEGLMSQEQKETYERFKQFFIETYVDMHKDNEQTGDFTPEGAKVAVESEYGVNINDALAKEPKRRSEAEQKAIEEYARRLYNGNWERENIDAADVKTEDASYTIVDEATKEPVQTDVEQHRDMERASGAKKESAKHQTVEEQTEGQPQQATEANEQRDSATTNAQGQGTTETLRILPEGFVEGAPKELKDGTELEIVDEDGIQKRAIIVGRGEMVRNSQTGYPEFRLNPEGNIIAYLIAGENEPRHTHITEINKIIKSHKPEGQPQPAEQPAETPTKPVQETKQETATSPVAQLADVQPANTNVPQMPAVNQPANDGNLVPQSHAPESKDTNIPETGQEKSANATEAAPLKPAADEMPMRADGEPDFMATTPENGHQYIYNQAGLSREEAGEFVRANIEAAEKELKKIQDKAPKMGTRLAKYQLEKAAWQAEVVDAQRVVDYWRGVEAIDDRNNRVDRENREEIAQPTTSEAPTAAQATTAGQQAEQKPIQQPSTAVEVEVPDVSVDRAVDARARGFRMKDGNRYDRQGEVRGVVGNDVEVDFTTSEKPTKVRYKVVEAESMQPSHVGGERNPLHFISEAQPKERTDDVSDLESGRIAANMSPERITASTNAYGGAPVVNGRGEVIQGNNRAIALRKMSGYPESAARYKQYLVDHAVEFGFDAESVSKMQHPVLVREADVTDEEAIRLGQFKASDLETGGVVRIDAAPTLAKMSSNQVERAMGMLFDTGAEDEGMTIGQLIDNNGGRLIDYLTRVGAITETQAQSAYGRNGRMTEEARNDLRKLMLQNIFNGGADNIENSFAMLPDAAQKALVQAMAGDMRLDVRDRLLPDVQNAIMAVGELRSKFGTDVDAARKSSKADVRLEEMRKVIGASRRQIDMISGQPALKSYSELELELAALMLTQNQNPLKAMFAEYQRLVIGTEGDMFNPPEKLSREEAVERVFNVKDTRYEHERQIGDAVESGAERAEELGRGERLSERDGSPEGSESVGRTDSNRVRDEQTRSQQRDNSGVDIRSLQKGLGFERGGDRGGSSREDEKEVGHQIIENAKESGVYIDRSAHKDFGKRLGKTSGESVVYVDKANGRVVKVKDPYAKSNLKGHVAADALYEHIVHNLLFPNTRYTLLGISEGYAEDVRFVLEQGIVDATTQAAQEQIDQYLTEVLGLTKVENPYPHYENDYYSITDVDASGDNVVVDDEGNLCFIDPIIKFKRPASEVVEYLKQKAAIAAAEAEVNTEPTEGHQPKSTTDSGASTATRDEGEAKGDNGYGENNKGVSRERYEELKERMRKKLRGQLNMGIDPEILAIGTEMAAYHLEAGARKFADFAKRMIEELGDAIRPYLKSFYNGARDLPEMERYEKEMTPYDEVKRFDVLNFDKEKKADYVEQAQHVAKENEAAQQAEEAKAKIKKERTKRKKDVSFQSQTSLFGEEESTASGATRDEAEGAAPKGAAAEQTSEATTEQPKSAVEGSEAQVRRAFSEAVTADMQGAMMRGEKPYRSIVDLRKRAESLGMKVDGEGRDDILIQELVEDGLVRAARTIAEEYRTSGKFGNIEAFRDICKLYDMQPTIAQRSSNRIKMQQYSTPLPMAYVADMFAWSPGRVVLEPTAGNGMLVFGVPAKSVVVNELDETRLANLKEQGFKVVMNRDASEYPTNGHSVFGGPYGAVIANPPFGSAESRMYDGKSIAGLDQQITLNALAHMRPDGRAAIIIGGNMEYAANGSVKDNKAFWSYLYDHYNVKGVVDMGGKLYAKQGTTYPTRMILIDGRRSEEERAQSTVYPPVKSKAFLPVQNFEDLYDLVEVINKNNKKTNGNEVLRTGSMPVVPNADTEVGRTDKGNTLGQPHEDAGNGRNGGARTTDGGGSRGGDRADEPNRVPSTTRESNDRVVQRGDAGVPAEATDNGGRPISEGEHVGGGRGRNTQRVDDEAIRTVRDAGRGVGVSAAPEDAVGEQPKEERGASTTPQNKRTEQSEAQPEGRTAERPEEKRTFEDEKLSYRPHNSAFSLQSVAPAAMVEAMDKTLADIERAYNGQSIDEIVTRQLVYDSVEEMHNALAAEQVDSVAMAIHQMKQGKALIIGDQTGVGKGRQMAALIRWAVKQGKKPIFFTQKASLFSDLYRDLVDIGSGDLKPFIFNSDGEIVDNNGEVVHKPLSKAQQDAIFKSRRLPDEYDFAVLTYSQVNTGDTQSRMSKDANGKRLSTGKSANKDNREKAAPKAEFLRELAIGNYLFLDESHTAAGNSNIGAYIRSIVGPRGADIYGMGVKAVTFASATFAKRPDTMPMYALRTAMSEANVEPDKLIGVIEKGGVALQEIMSRALTESGQMVRRERDMSDVKTDWETVSDPAMVQRARENYDKTIEAFNAIIDFQERYVKPMIDALNGELSERMSTANVKRGTKKMGVENVPFASKTYNYTKQLMLALKADAIVDRVEQEIKAGRHPVIALESTMEASLKDYAIGEAIDEPTFSASLLRGLDNCMQYTVKDEGGNERHSRYNPSDLGLEGEQAYYKLQEFIHEATKGVFISPLDAIIEGLHAHGYKVGELTGRSIYAEHTEDGKVVVRKRTDKDKKRMQRQFNSGELDVLILNKSASTGISLHASEKFSDQRQRSMIIAQPLSDINDYMQMIGRIDRTGQVSRGYYVNLGLPVPAESRFLMMLSTKLKSLNANTTTSQESESGNVEAPDLLNKYGSQVVMEYLRDNPDIYNKMGDPLKLRDGKGGDTKSIEELLEERNPGSDDSVVRKITGYVALLSTAEQDAFYNDVVQRYTDLIRYLDSTGTNDLKITVMPLKAKTLSKKVSSEGKDPYGRNPFAGDAYVEEVEMDVLRKPMKAAEVRKTIEQLNTPTGSEKGHLATAATEKWMGERVMEIVGQVQREAAAKLQAEEERYEAHKKKEQAAFEKWQEKINSQNRSEAEKQQAIERIADELHSSVERRHTGNRNMILARQKQMERGLETFKVGHTYLLPQNMSEQKEGQATVFKTAAIFCGYKTKKSGLTPSTTFAVFAALDGRRRVEVKLGDEQSMRIIEFLTNENWNEARDITLDNWDSKAPTETRKKGYIMTGNILQAVADTQDEFGRYPGQLISYSDSEGNIHDGILMPDQWQPSQLKTNGVPIEGVMGKIRNYIPIESTDGKVKLYGSSNARRFFLEVPKSKKEGQQYFGNDVLLRNAEGIGFYGYHGNMRADIPAANIDAVVKELGRLGVRVKNDNEYGNENGRRHRMVDDSELIARLDSEPKEVGYRNVVLNADGTLGSPMASKLGKRGAGRTATSGDWYDGESAERIGAFTGKSRKQIDAFKERQKRDAKKHFKETAEKLHLGDRVTFLDDDSELTESFKGKKGWYDIESGKITIVLGNHSSKEDVLKTLLHEGVGHYGLRAMFGENFDRFLDEVYASASKEVREQIVSGASKHGWDMREATEEYLSRLTEDTEFEKPEHQTWWMKIKDYFHAMLQRLLGRERFKDSDTKVELTDNELRYVLWCSYENLKEPWRYSYVRQAKDVAKQYELKVGDYENRDGRSNTEKKWWESAAAEAARHNADVAFVRDGDAYTVLGISEKAGEIESTIRVHELEERIKKMVQQGLKVAVIEENKPQNADEKGVRFRDGEEESVRKILQDGNLSLQDRILAVKQLFAEQSSEDATAKTDALNATSSRLSELQKAMKAQKQFDQTTVKHVTDLARILIASGQISNLKKGEIKRLLSAAQSATGKEDISQQVTTVLDIMVDSQLRQAKETLRKLEGTKAVKINSNRIRVQGKLDPQGTEMLSTFKEAAQLDSDAINNKISEVQEGLSSPDTERAERTKNKMYALQTALKYVEKIKRSEADESSIREEIREAENEIYITTETELDENGNPLTDEEGNPTTRKVKHLKSEYKNTTDLEKRRKLQQNEQFIAAAKEEIRQIKTDRIQAYSDIIKDLNDIIKEGAEQAQAFRQAEIQRIRDIHHMANSDMEGRELKGHQKDSPIDKAANNAVTRGILMPLMNLDQMLRSFGRKHPDGKGNMWEEIMPRLQQALDNERLWHEKYSKILNDKCEELIGHGYSHLDHYADSKDGITINYWDGGAMRQYQISQSQMMYLYAVEKMPMGKATNRKMGLTDQDMQTIENHIDPKLKEFVDWVQEELLPKLGTECNEVYKKMFGADMADIDHYFPFMRDKKALHTETQNGQQIKNDKITILTGAIKERQASTAIWDLPHCNFIDLLTAHIQEMSHWANFAEINRDLGTLLSYNHFKQQVMGMHTIYGAGENLWNNFAKCCAIATDSYQPHTSDVDKIANRLAKGITMGKIALRPYTAAKQLLSLPALFSDADPLYILEDMASLGLIPAYKPTNGEKGVENCIMWAWRNMPNFRKRIASRTTGDFYLRDTDESKLLDGAKWGMLPNIGVDAWTIAIGSHAVYRTYRDRFLRLGLDEKTAEKKALIQAELCFNKSQQSSEGAFIAPIQVDHTFLGASAMVFRNASTSYTREYTAANRNLMRWITGQTSIEATAKTLLRFTKGKDESTWTPSDIARAKKEAKRIHREAITRNLTAKIVYGWVLPALWRIGGSAPLLLLLSSDKKRKKEIIQQDIKQSVFGPLEGLTYGDVITDGLNMLTGTNEQKLEYLGRSNPILQDAQHIIEKLGYDPTGAASDAASLLVGITTGINPQTIIDWVSAIIDFTHGDKQLSIEGALLAARLLNCPPSQLKEAYFAELNLTGEQASKYTPKELIQRWATYKVRNGQWLTTNQEREEKIIYRTSNEVKTQVKTKTAEELNQTLEEIKQHFQPITDQIEDAKKTYEENPVEAAKKLQAIQQDTAQYRCYLLYSNIDKHINNLAKDYLEADTPQKAQQIRQLIEQCKRKMATIFATENTYEQYLKQEKEYYHWYSSELSKLLKN